MEGTSICDSHPKSAVSVLNLPLFSTTSEEKKRKRACWEQPLVATDHGLASQSRDGKWNIRPQESRDPAGWAGPGEQ